ncbi:hypothetical protein VNO78_32983 [Psophocarpus tetragonolobus]|uniref:Disease resistance R13L4/SHOC-2-like LRR domain-containing protein n=1 Tax=Psophocarpus tetragonolobus TaxID=3891 RepID=A0AAN9NX52_PSOTE
MLKLYLLCVMLYCATPLSYDFRKDNFSRKADPRPSAQFEPRDQSKEIEYVYPLPLTMFLNLSQLQYLDLSGTNLFGGIPFEIGNLRVLHTLKLGLGTFVLESCLTSEELDLSNFLDLSRNHFSGEIPSTISKIDRLSTLDLFENHLIGIIPWARQLQTFSASTFDGNIDLCGEPLKKIYLEMLLQPAEFTVGFNISRKSGEPKCIERETQALLNFIQGLHDDHIQLLDLHGLDIIGAVNLALLIDLQNLQYLDLSHNNFLWSHIPQLIGSFTNLTYLNLSFSGFGGRIPSTLGNLAQLQYLDLGGNDLLGAIPFQIGNLKHLQYLDLGDNSLSGEIPFQFGNLKQLQYLNLASNTLSGTIPFRSGNLSLLHTLRLSGNFEVKAKDAEWLSNLYSLAILELSSLHNLSSSAEWLQAINKLIPNLRELRLADCSLSDAYIKSLFYSHSNFSSALTYLDLSYNVLTSSTFQSFLMDRSFLVSSTSTMNSSSSLAILDLSYNLLKSDAMFYWLFNFTTNLRTLSIDGNLFEGPIPDGFGKVMNFVEDLSLYNNRLQGNIPYFLGNMCRLQSLDLSFNKLNGEISSFIQNSSWCNRQVLHRLYLSYNQIIGKIPERIGWLSELQELYLQGNFLDGEVTESHLSNFSKLKHLHLSHNSLSLHLVPTWVPPFHLHSLGLASCRVGPSFPSWLQTQSSLTFVDVSNNGLSGSVPRWFWNNLQIMYWLNMSHSNLAGAIPNIPFKLLHRPSIILNSNQFEGQVPSFLLQASELLLSQNKFSDLLPFLCDQSTTANLVSLDLSNNQIKGELPDCWKPVDPLQFLDLSSNTLSGNIPMSMGTLVKLDALILRNNSLMGVLPYTLKNCSNLIMLDVSENMLSGPIPSWIGESMQQLIILSMRGNNFSGKFATELCYLRFIQLLDLSRNRISQGIPKCLKNFTAMSEKSINRSEVRRHIYESNITVYKIYDIEKFVNYRLDITWVWKGLKQRLKDPELILKSIDLSCNNLTGEIPKEVGYLVGVASLNFSRNKLSGEIPSEIGNLSSLESLDLSRNHLSGRIPSSLDQIDFLGKLDLSHNSLSGRIPLGRHLETFDASSFEGNIDLCGEQLNKSCLGDQTTVVVEPQVPSGHGEDSVFYEALYLSMGVGYFVGFWGLMGPLLIWRPWRIAYLRFLDRLTNRVTTVVNNMPKFHV